MKSNKILYAIIIILVAVICLLSGFILGNSDLFNKENTNEEVNNNTPNVNEEDKIIELDVKDDEVNYLYNSISFDVCSSYKDYYYRYDKVMSKELSDEIKIHFAARSSEKVAADSGGYIIKENNLIKMYNQMFGKDAVYKFVELIEGSDLSYITRTDDPEEQKIGDIRYLDMDTCLAEIVKNVVKIEKNTTKDEIYVYEKVGFMKYLEKVNDEGNDLSNLYKDINKSILVYENYAIDYSSSFAIDLSSFGDKLDDYKYTFKSNGDGTYYFYSVERVK